MLLVLFVIINNSVYTNNKYTQEIIYNEIENRKRSMQNERDWKKDLDISFIVDCWKCISSRERADVLLYQKDVHFSYRTFAIYCIWLVVVISVFLLEIFYIFVTYIRYIKLKLPINCSLLDTRYRPCTKVCFTLANWMLVV